MSRTSGQLTLASRVWRVIRRPDDLIQSVRWIFVLLALVSLLVAVPLPLSGPNPMLRAISVVCAVVLAASWVRGYLTRSCPWRLDTIDMVAYLGFAASSLPPTVVLGFMFPALWFKSLYGSTLNAYLRGGVYALGFCLLVPLWPLLPEHPDRGSVLIFVGVVPTLFANIVVGRFLARSLQAREQTARRDSIQTTLGSDLLGVREKAHIIRIAWTAISAICAATPGVRVVKVLRIGDGFLVDRAAGGFASIPGRLPAGLLTLAATHGPDLPAVHKCAELDAAVGASCVWACLPIPPAKGIPGPAWMLVGAPRVLPDDIVVSIRGLINQVTLALHNSEVHQSLESQAQHDNLTGLANRSAFNAALSTVLAEGPQQTAVLFVNLDDFKDVNNKFGHGAGDELLCQVADRLRRTTRPADLCARLGGDEFAVLLMNTDPTTATDVARRIVKALSEPAQLGLNVAHVGASVGLAMSTADIDLEQLIRHADVAMYAAKAGGKARIQVFEAGLLKRDADQVAFERELSAATKNKQLVIHYQPILSLPDLRCIAVEALVRWQHPDRGLLFPDSFIEVAERIGAIRDIGAFVLRQSCSDAAGWLKAHPDSQLAIQVNVSALQLDGDDLIDYVTNCLAEFGLPAAQLVLEITESVAVSSAESSARIHDLAAQGVTIAIDDFGTGYSALTTLRTLPASIVKIDRSFVAGGTDNREDRAVIEAVVRMSSQMGLQTIAEGVERLDQETFLKAIGADAVQGYRYLRPTTAAAFGVWLEKNLRGFPQRHQSDNVVIPFRRHSA